ADGETSSRPFSFCQAFYFGPTWAKEKWGVTCVVLNTAANKILLVGAIIDRPKAIDGLRFSAHSHFSL
ncbi:MAG: hypothetical protein II369_00160, partial [Clostridia bacterium]|nr:hypothetical protein [Clostridia bacterium]